MKTTIKFLCLAGVFFFISNSILTAQSMELEGWQALTRVDVEEKKYKDNRQKKKRQKLKVAEVEESWGLIGVILANKKPAAVPFTKRQEKRIMRKRITSSKGLLVLAVLEESPGEVNGIVRDDIITAINSQSTKSIADIENILKQTQPKQGLTVSILRDGQAKDIQIILGQRQVYLRKTMNYGTVYY